VIDTRTPIMCLHFTLQPGGTGVQPIARDHQAIAMSPARRSHSRPANSDTKARGYRAGAMYRLGPRQ